MIKKIKSYLIAKFGPKAEISQYVERLTACLGCSWLVKKKTRYYCKGCGCPKVFLWRDSELKTKAFYKNATCPRAKWNNEK
jgi:hypothetical protein